MGKPADTCLAAGRDEAMGITSSLVWTGLGVRRFIREALVKSAERVSRLALYRYSLGA